MADVLDLLLSGDPVAAQQRQAALLRNQQQFQDVIQQGNQQGHALDLLNFAAQGSSNPVLAKSMAALNQSQQDQYTPQKIGNTIYNPGTGESAVSPDYADEKEADRETRRMSAASVMQARETAAQQAADARQYAADQAYQGRVLAATIAAQGAADRRADANARQQQAEQDRQQRMFQTSQGRLANLAQRTNLPALIGSSTELVNRMQPYVDAGQADNIPGLTRTDRLAAHLPLPYDWTQSGKPEEGATNMAMVKSAILDQLKTQVGLGGTNRARDEQLIETLSGPKAGSKDFIDAYNNAIHPRLEQQRKAALGITASWTPDQWQQHLDAGGIDYRVPIPKITYGGKGAAATPTASVPGVPGTTGGLKNSPAAQRAGVMHFDAQGNPVP